MSRPITKMARAILQPQTQPDEFTFFSKLPLELQREIWKHAAIPHRRVIEIVTTRASWCECARAELAPDYYSYSLKHHTPTRRLPDDALFHTCSESRKIAATKYKLITFCGSQLYCNPDQDILWIKGRSLFEFNFPPDIPYRPILLREGLHTDDEPSKFSSFAFDLAEFNNRLEIRGYLSANWLETFISNYALGEIWGRVSALRVERIYLVYSSEDQRYEARRKAGLLRHRIKSYFSRDDIFNPLFEESKVQPTSRMIPWVEAVLDTELF
ncbi:hypothetical protein NHQ30_008968 [Ciborinia camelliae]|nr:hypothetical protein NHQ30_008968 [Ciborinia camelliae]